MIRYFLFLLLGGIMMSCSDGARVRLHFEKKGRPVPNFNADSAYHYVAQQVGYGPRSPGSEAHTRAKAYLFAKLKDYAGPSNVFVQEFNHEGYDGNTLHLSNLIAAFNPANSDRIILCAHWDSRPRADRDSVDKDKPILGADDGASGVAVLLELARLFSKVSPHVGVDILLVDGEDYGKEGSLDEYFIGSRYWANHPPVKNYHPRFGILLDMVGGKGAIFPKEQYSLRFAPALVNEIWSVADEKGHDPLFPDEEGTYISDDHIVINRILNIPTIDIIRHKPKSEKGNSFASYWHTHKDNMNIISKKTLQAVGDVVTELVYNRL